MNVLQVVPSVEEPVDEIAVRALSDRLTSARQAVVASSNTASNLPLITASTTLEYGAQASHEESNIYGLVTLQAPSTILPAEDESLSSCRVPIDLVCVVDQSGSMSGQKMALLKQTLVYIAEQMNDLDRLAIVSFDTNAFDRSHGLKRMNQQNQQILTRAINNDINDGGGTYIGCGLHMGIKLFTNRQTKNPLGALLLLTDGQDNQEKRNLVFQLQVPKVDEAQDVEMASQQPMSQSQSEEEQLVFDNQTIGNVIITYVDPNSGHTITTTPVPFQLVRASHPSADLLQINRTLDLQRNRVETAHVLERAMNEYDYGRSLAILKGQVEKIKASVSAQDPFCQQLIKDLEYRYPSERDYRSSHHNNYYQHQTERGTYAPVVSGQVTNNNTLGVLAITDSRISLNEEVVDEKYIIYFNELLQKN
ncbi:unnamed protein product [Didymodactylos carnosus]|uniref:VWFA domain-containing protein n=1 Tax=Didymodactylos carnosus TaxID=1234261 RepID=A0A815VQV0_9BILA|nr:unnamed protein product [Didymodactylos carnosus]CAF1535410.1 unnamed protein product [Didymodactylos carnosus]CAF3645242.1 unnamed protein product [Didymodactylos carnosus]CAF4395102.1 unnamed protein product [Didymodactylos carnosus]